MQDAGDGDWFPAPDDFFLNVPLYERYALDAESPEAILNLEYFDSTIDTYCVECKSHSVFQAGGKAGRRHRVEELFVDRRFAHEFYCSRVHAHKLMFMFLVRGMKVEKIGQYPSLADMVIPEIQQYRKILGARYGELARALGLVSHGIGIGAFVYLRRVLEFLIEEAHQVATNGPTWDEVAYKNGRFDERVAMLRDRLPPFLVETKQLYGVLSKGIHELGEEECLQFFPAVRSVIELILDQRLEEKTRQSKMQQAKNTLSNLGIIPMRVRPSGTRKPTLDPDRKPTTHEIEPPPP